MELPHRAISVYMYLSDRANKENTCWPSIPTIAKDLKLSESTTRRALSDLRKAGLVHTEQRYRENGGNSSLLYRLLESAAERMVDIWRLKFVKVNRIMEP